MKIHTLPDTGVAYDLTQSSDDIKMGDVLIIESERVVGLADTWPFAVTEAYGQLHTFVSARPLSDDVKSKYAPYILRAAGQAILRGWPVRKHMLDLLTQVKNLTCACCGNYHKGRQWSNRDDGYGLCNDCIDDCVTNPNDWLEAGCAYGIPGVHYDIDGAHFRAKAGM